MRSLMLFAVLLISTPTITWAQQTAAPEDIVLKTFQLQHNDAPRIQSLLTQLFQNDSPDTDTSIQFGVDLRTNTLICSGLSCDIKVIENLIERVEGASRPTHEMTVYQLKNVPVIDVAGSLESWLAEKDRLFKTDNASKATIVTDTVSNSLIVSSTMDAAEKEEFTEVITRLDQRPDMIQIKMVITEKKNGEEKVISRPNINTIVGEPAQITIGSATENITIELNSHMIQSESVKVTNPK